MDEMNNRKDGIVIIAEVEKLYPNEWLLFEVVETDEQKLGVELVRKALVEPLRWIATNAGHDGSIVVERVKEGKDAYGFNAQTEQFEDMIPAGVIDPKKVVRCALQNAASVSSLLITTEAMVAEKPEKEPPPAMPGGMPPGGMGGMGGMM